MKNSIGPLDQLENGTQVRVGTKVGRVISSEVVDAVPSGKIVVHTIEFTHKTLRYPRQRMIELDRPIIRTANYSFIYLWESKTMNNNKGQGC